MIVQALPSAGKTRLAKGSRRFFDTDDIIERLGFTGKVAEMLKDVEAREAFLEACREADKKGMLLTNINLAKFGLRIDQRFAYDPAVYVEHIKLTDRTDLIDNFDEATLRKWAEDYKSLDNVVWLRVDEFLSDTDLML